MFRVLTALVFSRALGAIGQVQQGRHFHRRCPQDIFHRASRARIDKEIRRYFPKDQ
jgi:hypothetical protein